MNSIIYDEFKISPEEYAAGCVCRFCMLPCEQNVAFRIPWNEWQHSLLAAMYERIMSQELYISRDCPEFCCNKCSLLFSQTVAALDIFERSDTYWRGMLIVKQAISPKTEYVEFSDDDQFAEQQQQESPLDEIEFMKIETIDDLCSEFGERDHIQFDTATDDEPVIEVLEELEILPEVPKLLTFNKEDKGVVAKNTSCSVCDEICRTRVLLTRHMSKAHNIKLCARCNFTASDSITLQRHYGAEHKRKGSIDTISVCTECGKICTSPLSLNAHMRRVHDPFVPSQCTICSKVFRNQMRLRMHVVTHAEPSFQCDICSKMFRLKKHIIWHIKNTHVKTTNYVCSKCGKIYTEYTSFKAHEKKSCSELKDKKTRTRSTGKFSCSLCIRKFSVLSVGRRHYRQEHQIDDMSKICLICNHLASSKEDLRIHQDKMHIELRCSMCMRFCVTEFSLKLHIATHSTKERLFECTICHATFLKLPDLNLHYTRVHTTERPFKCTDCDFRFVTKFEMNGHWRHKHEHIRKYKCQWCDKTYVSMTELRAHEPNHTGIGHRRCKFCNAHFRQLYQLTKHMNTFHPDWKKIQTGVADCLI